MSILEIQSLQKKFGQLFAVDRVDMKVDPGLLMSVIGPNGAGKTTLFNLISGQLVPDKGSITLNGKSIVGLPPHKIVERGISRSFQITNIFPELAVLDNIRIGLTARFKRSYDFFHSLNSSKDIEAEALTILESIGLIERKDDKTNTLSHGDLKLLEFGLALTTRPIVMLLDEPTAGMNQEETDNTVNLIKKISREKGITVILTEHDIDLVFSISDKILVLSQGRPIAQGTPQEIKENLTVKKAYLGEE